MQNEVLWNYYFVVKEKEKEKKRKKKGNYWSLPDWSMFMFIHSDKDTALFLSLYFY